MGDYVRDSYPSPPLRASRTSGSRRHLTPTVQRVAPWTVKWLRNYSVALPDQPETRWRNGPAARRPPGRLHLLWLLSNDEVDVTTLVTAAGGTKAGISQHLAKMRLAGWIDARRYGRRLLYRVTDPHIVTLVHQAVEHILDLRAT